MFRQDQRVRIRLLYDLPEISPEPVVHLRRMTEIRRHIDKLEEIVDDQMWPLPKYRELLFLR